MGLDDGFENASGFGGSHAEAASCLDETIKSCLLSVFHNPHMQRKQVRPSPRLVHIRTRVLVDY